MEREESRRQQDIPHPRCYEPWSNAACCGYVRLAGESLGYREADIRNLLHALEIAFSRYSTEGARRKYYQP